MIRLRDLFEEEHHEEHTIWQTHNKLWGARSDSGVTRYFNNREEAAEYLEKGFRVGRPEPKDSALRKEPVQKDDRSDI